MGTNKTMNKTIACWTAALPTGIFCGCQTTPTADTKINYIPAEYRKLVSGVFVDELANKYVQVDCRFMSTMAGTLPRGFSPNRYMSFMVVAPTEGLEAPEPLTVVAPKDLADVVF